MSLERRQQLKGVGSGLSMARHSTGFAETTLGYTELAFRRAALIDDDLAKNSHKKVDGAEDHRAAAQETMRHGVKLFVEMVGSDPSSVTARHAVEMGAYATGILSGEIEFEGAKLPDAFREVSETLSKIQSILHEALGHSDDVADRVEAARAGLSEVGGRAGALDRAITSFRHYQTHLLAND